MFWIPAILARWTAWNGNQQMMKLETKVAHISVTLLRSLSDREDGFLFLFDWVFLSDDGVKPTVLLSLVSRIRVLESRRTISP